MSSRPSSLFIVVTVLIAILVCWLMIRTETPLPVEKASTALAATKRAPGTARRERSRVVMVPSSSKPEVASLGARLAQETGDDDSDHQLSGADLAKFLSESHSNAVSLVAAFETTHRREYLEQAAGNFPDDPLVQAQVLMHKVFPEERQKWIDALKKSSPGNSLPNFLLATDFLNSGDATGAVRELQAAQGKTFRDYSRETAMGLEEAYLSAGRSPAEAKAYGSSEVLLPALAPFKDTVRKLSDVAEQYRAAGDLESARTVLESMWQTGHQLRAAGNEGTIITELVGLAMENISLQRLDPASAPGFLSHSVQEELARNKDFRQEIRASVNVFTAWLPTAQDNELIIYFDRLKLFGERAAMNWLQERRPDLAPPPVTAPVAPPPGR